MYKGTYNIYCKNDRSHPMYNGHVTPRVYTIICKPEEFNSTTFSSVKRSPRSVNSKATLAVGI